MIFFSFRKNQRQIIIKVIDLHFFLVFLSVKDDFNIIMAHLFDNFSCVRLASFIFGFYRIKHKIFSLKKETIDRNRTRTQIIVYSLSKLSHIFISIFFCFFCSFVLYRTEQCSCTNVRNIFNEWCDMETGITGNHLLAKY